MRGQELPNITGIKLECDRDISQIKTFTDAAKLAVKQPVIDCSRSLSAAVSKHILCISSNICRMPWTDV